jgi:DNA-binding NarL/FixJ family response regulator
MARQRTGRVRVVVARDDSPTVDGLQSSFYRDEAVEIVGCARDYAELERLAELREPDVVLMHSRLYRQAASSRARRHGSSGLVLLPPQRTAVQREGAPGALEVLDVILGLATAEVGQPTRGPLAMPE